jgi:hypothetical protein
MGPVGRVICAAMLASIGFTVAGCDYLDSLEIFDTKKKLPGERKPVFPEGVPGVTQGIPPDLQKGYNEQAAQQSPDPATTAVQQLTAQPEPKEKPKPKPKPKLAAKPRPKPPNPATAQAQPPQQAAPQGGQPAGMQPLAPWPGSQPQHP